jgi:hypothetical protein
MVWRDRGEPAIDIHDIHECLVHGARGALRALLPPHRCPRLKFHFVYRCWYHCLCYPFWRESGLTFDAYQEFVQVCFVSRVPTRRDILTRSILLGRSVFLSYGMHSSDQIPSVQQPC